MKTVAALGVVGALFLLVSVGFAQSGPSLQSKQIAALQKDVRTLKGQVAKLNKQQADAGNDILANYQGDACVTAITADSLQGTWVAIDDLAKKAGQAPYFGAQTRASDMNSCLVGITRNPAGAPQTIAPFQSVIQWLVG